MPPPSFAPQGHAPQAPRTAQGPTAVAVALLLRAAPPLGPAALRVHGGGGWRLTVQGWSLMCISIYLYTYILVCIHIYVIYKYHCKFIYVYMYIQVCL